MFVVTIVDPESNVAPAIRTWMHDPGNEKMVLLVMHFLFLVRPSSPRQWQHNRARRSTCATATTRSRYPVARKSKPRTDPHHWDANDDDLELPKPVKDELELPPEESPQLAAAAAHKHSLHPQIADGHTMSNAEDCGRGWLEAPIFLRTFTLHGAYKEADRSLLDTLACS